MTTATSPTVDAWVRRYHPHDDAPVRLVCFPHAGSSAPYFLPMAAGLGAAVDVLSVQYPGRQERRHEPLIDSIDTLAERCTEALRPWLDRPFALFGHSMGATVAFEVARRLEAEGHRPAHLFASGRRAPSRTRDESVHRRDDDGIIAEMRSLSGTDTRVFAEEELLRMVLPVIRNDYKAAETYEYRAGPLLQCPVTVLTGHDDPKVSVEEAEAWREHTAARSVLHVYGGGHFFLAEHISAVLALVGASLRSA
ncbi:thioesterase II family protein [Dactylosporangium matsuzakiense]|uniref:Oleoyl-ACP hydrolase n=1 Tax=Dactylosporangium matsuzakiense TaxID=53360 RepID=A0A9W6KT60_9ACTN|nr:alpha/beta fold hydrolase [Dactylosporangium matsuzakiense]UWZ41218.1 thioesterase [Dactylosporangium matsuzakiense]GLL07696.1 oleoyl-ACP hydrolase [Dactylosporangium matsuzakiense]